MEYTTSLEIVKVLVKNGATGLSRGLHHAAQNSALNVIEYLLENGADINMKSHHEGKTALHHACQHGNLEVVTFLVEKNADLDVKDNEGLTPLHLASMSNLPEVVNYLIERKVTLFEKDIKGMTALDYASNLEKIKILTRQGATHAAPFKALMNALKFSKPEQVEYLVENNYVNINEKDEEGNTALHKAIEYTRSHIAYLIGKGADVNAKDNSGRTPLHVAAGIRIYGMEEAVNSLLNNEADLEAKDLEGMTALHYAAKEGLPNVVRLLVEVKNYT